MMIKSNIVYHAITLLVCYLSCLPICSNAAKILMFPGPFSHFGVMSKIARALHEEGHNITFVGSRGSWIQNEGHYDLWTYGGDLANFEKAMNQLFSDSMAGKSQFDGDGMAQRQAALTEQIEDFFKEAPSLRERAIKEKFDVAMFDAFVPQVVFLIKSLKLPFIVFACGAFDPVQHARLAQSPSPLSYVPVGFTPIQMTDRMTFVQRLTNTLLYFANQLAFKYFLSDINVSAWKAFPELKDLTFDGIMAEADLWIANTDFTLEFPRPLTPNVVYVGGLTARPPQRLPKDLEKFVSGSGDAGLIVFSLGTTIKDMEDNTCQVFADVFSSLPQRVIWRYAGTRLPIVADNVKFMEWIPQNDLLGHPKTRLFINHAGMSGVMEAIYHGVPIVAIPIFGDQFDIATRIVAKGIGGQIKVDDVNRVNLKEAINEVLEHTSGFHQRAKSLSAQLRSSPQKPLDRAVHWVEYVIQHGGRHLQPVSHDLYFHEYLLLDVISCIAAILLVVSLLVKTLLCCCCGCCCRKNKKLKGD